MERLKEISLQRRIWLWIAAWGCAILLCIIPNPKLLAVALLFPYGLFALCVNAQAMHDITGMAALGWIIYSGLTMFGLSQKRPARYFVAYGILGGLLILNVVGCHCAANNTEMRT